MTLTLSGIKVSLSDSVSLLTKITVSLSLEWFELLKHSYTFRQHKLSSQSSQLLQSSLYAIKEYYIFSLALSSSSSLYLLCLPLAWINIKFITKNKYHQRNSLPMTETATWLLLVCDLQLSLFYLGLSQVRHLVKVIGDEVNRGAGYRLEIHGCMYSLYGPKPSAQKLKLKELVASPEANTHTT